jgi:hypothetical protein
MRYVVFAAPAQGCQAVGPPGDERAPPAAGYDKSRSRSNSMARRMVPQDLP